MTKKLVLLDTAYHVARCRLRLFAGMPEILQRELVGVDVGLGDGRQPPLSVGIGCAVDHCFWKYHCSRARLLGAASDRALSESSRAESELCVLAVPRRRVRLPMLGEGGIAARVRGGAHHSPDPGGHGE